MRSQTNNVWLSETAVSQWCDIDDLKSLWHWMKLGYLPTLCRLRALLAGSLAGKRILDAGCGDGRITRLYRALYNADITGIDTSAPMIARALKVSTTTHLPYASPLFLHTEPNAFPFPPATFDAVISHWVLVTIPSRDGIAAFARESHRVLRPGGHFLALVNNNPDGTGIRTLGCLNGEPGKSYASGDKLPVTLFKQDPDAPGDILMQFDDYYWTEQDYISALHDAGFEHVDSFVPKHMDKDVVAESQYLQSKGLFPDVPFYEDQYANEITVRILVARKADA